MKSLPRWDNRTIESMRPDAPRPAISDQPISAVWEVEPVDKSGATADVLTLLLRGSECKFRCLMCDLWRSTHRETTPAGALPSQIASALDSSHDHGRSTSTDRGERWIKLYNASNFFSSFNVPSGDLQPIAELVHGFDRVVVENHPKLIGPRITAFRDMLAGRLEIAMGLETIHPQVLPALNKQMTLDDFRRACDWLLAHGMDVRAFVLLRPPGLSEEEGVDWCERSIDFAESVGVRHVSIIPVRGGNGALDELSRRGLFESPLAASLEAVMRRCVTRDLVVTADLWDWEKLRGVCQLCSALRRDELHRANRMQIAPVKSECARQNCGAVDDQSS